MVKTCLPIAHTYADDSLLSLSFQPDNELTETITSIEGHIKAVRAWMLKDKLKLNEEKMELYSNRDSTTTRQSIP